MNSKKLIKFGFVVAMAATPYHLSASVASTQDGLNACATAMVDQLAENQGAPMAYSLAPDSDDSKKPLSRRDVIHLDARDQVTQEVVARVDCVIDKGAQVQELITVPLDAPDARMRATQLD